ncbi:hypothetical protein Tco_0728072 [Tanacetum coccineum]|uniref:Retrotransposon gag domain-containing protein n=1 Tax=Tanacetum coccineum TaxID=301880 RepID=A0ABQ4YL75_9ASTR
MPPCAPRRFKKKSVRKIVEKRVAKAIEKYEKTRADSNNTGGSGSTNTGGTVVPEMHGCSYKTFMNGKPHSFKGTEGVVGLKRWFEKMEQVFEICKCAEDDKVKFAMCTFEGRALTWWNRNVQTLGLANANQIPWSNVKAMMTTEYCPATEAINMARELVKQAIQGRAARIGESNKRKWEDNQRNNNNNNHNYNNHNNNNNRNRNNNHHQQQNRRQENVRAYAAAPTGGKIYAGNLQISNRCNYIIFMDLSVLKVPEMPKILVPQWRRIVELGLRVQVKDLLQNGDMFLIGKSTELSCDSYEKIVRIPLPNGKIP